jgi:hypothetical protein
MNDFVAFEPNRLDQLAKRLQTLARTLDGDLDQIASIIEGLGGHITGSSRTRYWATKAQDDANDMTFRAQRAWEAYRRERQRPPLVGPVAHPGTVGINWVETSQGGRQAAGDAAGFTAAARNKNAEESRRELRRLAQSLRNHVGDKDYLSTFWSHVDPGMAARLARLLHDQDAAAGVGENTGSFPLGDESKNILANVAAGLVALRSNGLALPPQVREAMVNPPGDDLWSPIMLAKFGPNGDKWDPHLLAAMAHHQLYRIDERGTYRDLDPMRAILTKVGESSAASRVLLGDQDTGVSDAATLMRASALYAKARYDGLPGIDDVAGRVMVSAARVQRGDGAAAHYAAQSVANLVAATHQWVADKGRLRLELPRGVRSGMVEVAALYLPDFAASSSNSGSGVQTTDKNTKSWHVVMGHDFVKDFLREAAADPKDLGFLKGKAKAYVSVASMMSVLGRGIGTYTGNAAGLLGMLQAIDAEQKISKGREKDVDAEAAKGLLDTLNSLAGLIPGEKLAGVLAEAGAPAAGKGAERILARLGDARTVADLFMGDSPQAEERARLRAAGDSAKERFGINALIVEGLIRAGRVRPPTDPRVFSDGHIVPGLEFQDWYANHGGVYISVDGQDEKGGRVRRKQKLEEYVDALGNRFKSVEDWA